MFDVFLKWVYTIQRQRTKGDKKTMKKTTINKLVNQMKEDYKGFTTHHDNELMLINHKVVGTTFDTIDIVVIDKFLNNTTYVLSYYVENTTDGYIRVSLHKYYNIDTYANAYEVVEFERLNKKYNIKDAE